MIEDRNLFKNMGIKECSWWTRFLLKFRPVYSIGVDLARGDDYGCKVYMKEMNNIYYITKIARLMP